MVKKLAGKPRNSLIKCLTDSHFTGHSTSGVIGLDYVILYKDYEITVGYTRQINEKGHSELNQIVILHLMTHHNILLKLD